MFARFLKVFGLILLFMLILAAFLWAAILIIGDDVMTILIATLVMMVLALVAFAPYLDWVSKRVFRFPGEGEPLPETDLRSLLMGINGFDAPVMVEERRGALVATWKYVDARWWEILAKAGLTKVYELHIKLDESRQLATLVDVTKSVAWRAGPTEVRVRGGFFRGVMWAYEIGKQWGVKENFQLGKIYDYRFVPQEIKYPIMNSLLRSGWDVRFGIW